jgi:hypothetical protein
MTTTIPNVTGSPSDNITDQTGQLIGTYRDEYLGKVGHEVSSGDVTQVEGNILNETFESANTSITNDDGFSWGNNNRTSVVYGDGTTNKVVWSNGVRDIEVTDGRNWSPYQGEHSLRFRYAAGESMTEQRFSLGNNYTDFWMSYWIRVPVNFTHGNANNKFLSIWPNQYNTRGGVVWSTYNDGSGGAVIGFLDGGDATRGGDQQLTPFITASTDRGRWMHVVFHYKVASSVNALDGSIEMWRKWEDESNYIKLHEKLNADTWDPNFSTQGISAGYLMGWANDPYDVNTEWLIDDFRLSTSPLF